MVQLFTKVKLEVSLWSLDDCQGPYKVQEFLKEFEKIALGQIEENKLQNIQQMVGLKFLKANHEANSKNSKMNSNKI